MMSLPKLNKYIQVYIAAIVFTFILPNILSSQEKIEFNTLKDKYPQENEIVLKNETMYSIRYKKGKLEIFKSSYFDYLIMNQKGIRNYTENFHTSELSPVRDHSAYTLTAEGNKVKTNVEFTSNSNSNSIFFDDIRETKVTFRKLEPGARKILKTNTEFLDPALLHKFIFGNIHPTESMSFSVEVDKDIEIGYKIFNGELANIKYDKKEKSNKTIHTWVATNLQGYKYEEMQPSFLSIIPHIAIYIKSYPQGEGRQELFGDVSNLFKHYGTYVAKLNKSIDPELQEITKTLVANIETEQEKVKAIYYWVKDNIKYIAYENGYEGFVPRDASFVCERKFGDCKDMASILTAMCNYAGVENVKLAWIGSRDLPYTYSELPTPGTDNHMIAAYIKADDVVFLDATDQNSRYGLCSSFIQGKEALIRLNEEEYLLQTVPIIAADINQINLNINASIEETRITGDGIIAYNGLARANTIAHFESIKDHQKFKFITETTNLGNNKYKLDDYKEKNRALRDAPFQIDFKFHLDNYIVSLNNELFINMFLKDIKTIKSIKNDRQYPIEHDYKDKTSISINLDLRKQYDIGTIPKTIDIENNLFIFNSEYIRNGDKLELKYQFELKQLKINPEDFATWNEGISKIKEYMKESIVLKKMN